MIYKLLAVLMNNLNINIAFPHNKTRFQVQLFLFTKTNDFYVFCREKFEEKLRFE